MEEKIQIKLDKKYVINGILSYKEKSNRLVIFVHGFSATMREHQFFNGIRFFNEKGFDTFGFNLYSWEENTRDLIDCTIKTHSRDLEIIVDQFKDRYDKIFLIGHSLGCPTILWSNQNNVASVVLWDPSIDFNKMSNDDLEFREDLNLYIINDGVNLLTSKEMIEEWKCLDKSLIDYIVKPTKIICAENSCLKDSWKNYIKNIKVENDFVIIRGANHNFDEEGCEQKLFEETLKWISKN